jgi:hypothetical protein
MSCSTKASRSAGVSVSSTTSRARPTESASTASSSGPTSPVPGGHSSPAGSSGRLRRARSMFSASRPVTVVSQPPRFATSLTSVLVRRSQVSWTASSASVIEPSSR